jgi:UDP-N-acetylglucosamine--N-acetylmuramyl-(pentapeptide) pyrophosphoryl-undecaprenol N-acetylglucosamine transferase
LVNEKTVLIAAGGTGGHIYPALAIAAALKRQMPGLDVQFVGTPHGLENKLVPREGYKLHHIPIGRLNRNVSWSERLMTLISLPWAILKAILLVHRLNPRFVLGVGGHVTGPVILATSLLRKPAYLWEPNAHPGLANRWLAPFVREALVVFDEAAQLLKTRRICRVGMPVRAAIEDLAQKTTGTTRESVLRILVFGGSQGARGLMTSSADRSLKVVIGLRTSTSFIKRDLRTSLKSNSSTIRLKREFMCMSIFMTWTSVTHGRTW